jgi:hypothetical protein
MKDKIDTAFQEMQQARSVAVSVARMLLALVYGDGASALQLPFLQQITSALGPAHRLLDADLAGGEPGADLVEAFLGEIVGLEWPEETK